ncbi:hypothetical protein [Peptostreptococcus russellii]
MIDRVECVRPDCVCCCLKLKLALYVKILDHTKYIYAGYLKIVV